MIFNFNISLLSIISYVAATLCIAYICIVYCGRLLKIRRIKRLDNINEIDDSVSFPSASVIIFSRTETEMLEKNLPHILEQDYPAPFEVIIVNEGASAETNMAVARLKTKYPNIYLTYTPEGVRSLSRKKLALTIGVKAAKGDVVVITDANTFIRSDKWLKRMMEKFSDPNVDVVLGYGFTIRPKSKALGIGTRIFDMTADSVTWLSSAINGKPYRGCGYNLAYKKSLFFQNKGFSNSLNLRQGDDDIFVSEIANENNTEVQLSDDAIVGRDYFPFKQSTMDFRVSHTFTGAKLKKGSRRIMALGEWCLWGVILFSCLGAYLGGIHNGFTLSLSFVMILAAFIVSTISWQRTLKALHATVASFAIPFIMLTRPLRNAIVNLRSHFVQGEYTWQKAQR